MARLPGDHADGNAWGTVLNEFLRVSHNEDGTLKTGVVVTGFTSAAINDAIAASSPGQAILFPGGTYNITETVLLAADRAYLGSGMVILKQATDTLIDYMVKMNPAEPYPRRNVLWFGIRLDGDAMDPNEGTETNNTLYTELNGLTGNNGMMLDSLQFSNFVDLQIRGFGRDGLVLRGTDDPEYSFDKTTSTLHFISPYIYGNGRYGVYFGERTDDNHIIGGDIGANNYENIYMVAGSSSVRDSTVWGSKRANGVLIGAPTNQLIGNQIEGNAQHGVKITDYGSYNFISGNKVYYNSTQTPGGYDGINIGGTDVAHFPKYNTITDNFIYAGIGDFFLTEGEVDPSLWVGHRHAITLEDSEGQSCYGTYLNGNRVDLNAPGAGYGTSYPDTYQLLGVYGLKEGDEYNGFRWTNATEDAVRVAENPRTQVPGIPWYRNDTGSMYYYSGVARDRVERILTSGTDTLGGGIWAAGGTTEVVTFPTPRWDAEYIVILTPSWDSQGWWITAKDENGFTANFHTGPGVGGAHVDWLIVKLN